MKSLRNSFAAFAAICIVTSVAQAAAAAPNPSGTWTFQVQGGGRGGRGGGGGGGAAPAAPAAPVMQEYTLVLTVTGTGATAKLTGSQTAPGRGGGEPVKTDIADATIVGDTITFSVPQPVGGGRGGQGGGEAPATPPPPAMVKYTGKISADGMTITGTRTPPGRGGAEPTPVEWIAKKQPATPAAK